MKEQLIVVPEWQTALRQNGCHTFHDFFRFEGEVVHCHASRDISRVHIGDFRGFLKREFHIPAKEFFASWWAGFGWGSKSWREWNVLRELERQNIGVSHPVAFGFNNGRAFLLLEELPNHVDLHSYLRNGYCPTNSDREDLARTIGQAVARMHEAGFTHPDLYAKHVFLNLKDQQPAFLDLQRSRRRRHVHWHSRWRDLAALDASLGDQLVSPFERFLCLRSYLRACGMTNPRRCFHQALWAIARRTNDLMRRKKVRAMRAIRRETPKPATIEYKRIRIRANTGEWVAVDRTPLAPREESVSRSETPTFQR